MKLILNESQYKSLYEGLKGNIPSTKDEFIEKSKKVHVNDKGLPLYDYSLVDYINSYTNVKVMCPRHNEEHNIEYGTPYFMVTPSLHLQGKGVCPYENKRNMRNYSDELLRDIASRYNSKTEFESNSPKEYYSSRQRNKTLAGFYEDITKHFTGQKKSFGESLIENILIKNNIRFEREKEYELCKNELTGRFCRKLPFDFYLLDHNVLIEFDGEQHFIKSQHFGKNNKFERYQLNDVAKNKFCLQGQIPLIRVSYKANQKTLETDILKSLNNEKITLIGNGYEIKSEDFIKSIK
jgi:hypothetical protein